MSDETTPALTLEEACARFDRRIRAEVVAPLLARAEEADRVAEAQRVQLGRYGLAIEKLEQAQRVAVNQCSYALAALNRGNVPKAGAYLEKAIAALEGAPP